MGNRRVLSDGSVRILVHHLSRACEGDPRSDLWSSYLLLRIDDGLLAPAEGITTFRSCARSSKRVSTGGRRLTVSSSRWPRAAVPALAPGAFWLATRSGN